MSRYERHRDALAEAVGGLHHVLATAAADATIPSCPGWTIADLGAHVTDVHRWP